MTLTIKWHDDGREPKCAPNPDYPKGIDTSRGATRVCSTPLPYPAQRCGYFIVRCTRCNQSVAITTAGRPDDPRSIKLACLKGALSRGH
jgi:hypothetical protein